MIAGQVLDTAFLVLAVAALGLVVVVGLLVSRRGLGRFSLSASPKDGVKVDLTGVQKVEQAVRDEIATVHEAVDAMRTAADERLRAIETRMDRYEAQNSREHTATAKAVDGLTRAVTGLTSRMDGVEDAMTTPGGH